MKLALGTAQFGMKYGVANTSGRVGKKEVLAILEAARGAGISTLDTAVAYGNSEQVLGSAGVNGFKVISKVPPRSESHKSISKWVIESVEGSLASLKAGSLHGMLLHRPLDLVQENGCELYEALLSMKKQGMIEKIGISVYGPEDLDKLSHEFSFDIVQAPMNILDRRLENSGWLGKLNSSGTEVHIRSAFLQGLLLMPSEKRPNYFAPWKELLASYDAWIEKTGLSPLQACLGYLEHHPGVDKIVVGVESVQQLQEIVSGVSCTAPSVPDTLQVDDLNLINPAFWKL